MIAVGVFLIITVLMVFFLKKLLKGDISSPSQILCYIFIAGAVFCMAGLPSWSFATVTPWGVMILLVSIVCFILGEVFSIGISSRSTAKGIKTTDTTALFLPVAIRFFNGAVCVLAAVLYYSRMIEMAVAAGYTGGDNLMQYIRIAVGNGGTGYTVVILSNFCTGLSVVYAYYFFGHIHHIGLKNAVRRYGDYLLVIGCTMVISYISTSRYNFIKYAAIYLMEFIFINKQARKSELKFGKYFRIAALSLAALFAVFIVTGNSRLSFNDSVSGADKFVVYRGSSIPGFCYGLDNPDINRTHIFAGTTLTGVYSLIEYVGGPHFNYIKFLDYFPVRSGLVSNVYTAQYNLLLDFGYIGMFLIMAALGFVYGLVYTRALNSKSDTVRILYSYYIYYPVMSLWNPTLFQDILAIRWLMEMFFIISVCGLIKIFIKNTDYYKKRKIKLRL